MIKKKSILSLCLLLAMLCIAQFVHAQTFVMKQFEVNPEGADVLLEWEVQAEEEVQEYQLYRKLNSESVLTYVTTLDPSGEGYYEFLDDQLFKQSGFIVNYELHVVTERRTYKFYTALSHSPTSVQRTWGSIKAMFR